MPTNVIINGTFNNGNAGWSGTDIETNHPENAYLANGSTNRVAELDGNSGQTTVMEQTFAVTNPLVTSLTLDTVLRNASAANSGNEGFTLEIIDSTGTVIASQTVLPTTGPWQAINVPVTFANAGNYTLRMTEVGPDDSLGAIIDKVSLLICFGADTLIDCPGGRRHIRDIGIGDRVDTANGPQRVRWVGRRHIGRADMDANPKLRPLRIRKGALGPGIPERDLLVSRQHRILIRSRIAHRMFGVGEVLVAAFHLLGLPGVEIDASGQPIEYVHLLFDAHQIITAEGTQAESLLTGPEALAAVSAEARAEILTLLPDLATDGWNARSAALIPGQKRQKRLIARHMKNERALVRPL